MSKFAIPSNNAFSVGPQSTLEAILDHREKRSAFQRKLGETYPNTAIISFKCNIPGPIKNNEVISYIFNLGHERILSVIDEAKWCLSYHQTVNLPSGIDGFYVVSNVNVDNVKRSMVYLEERDNMGRLFDLDVLTFDTHNLLTLSRTDLGFHKRKCLMCEDEAKACGRSRKHSVSELHEKILEYLIEEKGAEFIDTVS